MMTVVQLQELTSAALMAFIYIYQPDPIGLSNGSFLQRGSVFSRPETQRDGDYCHPNTCSLVVRVNESYKSVKVRVYPSLLFLFLSFLV